MLKRSRIISVFLFSLSMTLLTASWAREGYQFQLKLTSPDARHDPDGVWSDDDLNFVRSSGLIPKIYTARIETPAGKWLLSQLSGVCNMQGMCDAQLIKIEVGKPPQLYANPLIVEGGKAELSLNYKRLTTQEIDQNGRPFIGKYVVGPIR
ncbi:hypothetical protein FY156_29060 (plasmid) [Agrobacterium tumefaciens]|nr:hypothetical protein FY156_29060 [Agrobacterium tumefaciens]